MKNPNKILRQVLALAVVLSTVVPVRADAPLEINYQGKVTDSNGIPLQLSGTDVTFFVYPNENGSGAPVDTIALSGVQVLNGVFSAKIALNSNVFQVNKNLWLQVRVNGKTYAPLQKLVAAPYALAVAANSVGSLEIKDNTITSADLSSTAGITAGQLAGSIPYGKLSLSGAILGTDLSPTAGITAGQLAGGIPAGKVAGGTFAAGADFRVPTNLSVDGSLSAGSLTVLGSITADSFLPTNAIPYSKLNLRDSSGGGLVVSADIKNGEIISADLSPVAGITAGQLAGAIPYGKLSLAAGDVPYDKLSLKNTAGVGLVTGGDLSPTAGISYNQLALADNIIPPVKLQAIPYGKLALRDGTGGLVSTEDVKDGAITPAKLAAGGVSADKVSGGTFAAGANFQFPAGSDVTVGGKLEAAGGLQVGVAAGGEPVVAVQKFLALPVTSVTFPGGAIGARMTKDSDPVSFTGAAPGDVVLLGPPANLHGKIIVMGYVAANNQVVIRAYNSDTGNFRSADGDYRLSIIKY